MEGKNVSVAYINLLINIINISTSFIFYFIIYSVYIIPI